MRPADPNWFIALTVDPGTWYGPFLRSIPRHIRAFNAQDLHITVAFLRDCGETRARLAWEAVVGAFREPLALTIGTVEPFGNRWRPSAVALVGGEGSDEVAAFMDSVRDLACFKAGAEPDTRPPKPHITIVRPPKRGSLEEIREILAWAEAAPNPNTVLQLSRLALYTRSVERGRQFREVEVKELATEPG